MEIVTIGKEKKSKFIDKVKDLLPEGGNLNLCLTCGACASGCPASGLEDMDPRKFLRLASLGLDEEITTTPWVWMCSMCTRCVYVCPMKINIPQLVYYARQSWPRENRPKGILGSCEMALRSDTCSAMGASEEDFKFVVEDVLDEYREGQPEFAQMTAPVNKKGAEFFLNQNSREPVTEPDEMVPLWKILHLAGADWTYGTKGWAAENYCMFLADDAKWEHVVRTKVKAVEDLGCKVWLNTEWGHELFAVRFGLQKFNIKANFEIKSIIQYYAQWIRDGKLKVNSDWNANLKAKFTVQDPCQLVRKSFGDPVAEDLRFVVKTVVGEENFIDMTPNRSNNYCCGGGGGFLQSGYPEARREYGKLKYKQIAKTRAHYCITPCHNCHAQIHDLSEHFEAGYHTVHLWTIICLAMGILGPKERTYLGDDLKDILMFHPEMEE